VCRFSRPAYIQPKLATPQALPTITILSLHAGLHRLLYHRLWTTLSSRRWPIPTWPAYATLGRFCPHPSSTRSLPWSTARRGQDEVSGGLSNADWSVDMKRCAKAVHAILTARVKGATLRQAAAVAGVHVATVWRWQVRDPKFAAALREAERFARQEWHPLPRRRQAVSAHPSCPVCSAPTVVRRAGRFIPFWGCSRWPWCGWASWRPRHPTDCPTCRGPRYWSHSRLSVACPRCGP
jgi:hypothetical protein